MAWETSDGDAGYFLAPFDADGAEVGVGHGLTSDQVVANLQHSSTTDVILMSHGWNGDVPAARSQYSSWLDAMAEPVLGRQTVLERVPDFEPLVIGLHWPSKAWGDEELGDASFAIGTDDAADPMSTATAPSGLDALVDEYTARLVDTQACRDALATIFEAALDDIAPDVLPDSVRAAYAVIDREISLGVDGVGAPPGDDREAFDVAAVYEEAMSEDELMFGGGGLGGLLAPLRTLTFWQMKRRARNFGESAVSDLLRRLQTSTPPDRKVRYHLVGHSFGCIVAAAGVCGSAAGNQAPVDSLVLIQGALSIWSFSSEIPGAPERVGYFSRLVGDGLVRGPVITTMSEHDRAVGFFYPLGARAGRQVSYDNETFPRYGAVGTYGARGSIGSTEDLELRDVDQPYAFQGRALYNLEASRTIATGGGVSGAHSDICHPEVAHAVWSAILATV